MTTATQPAIREPGAGPRVLWMGSELIDVLVDGRATGGQLSLLRVEAVGAGHGPPPHTHSGEDETFVVLEGSVAFACGENETTLGPGGAAFLPRGLKHGF